MRELSMQEIDQVSGGYLDGYSAGKLNLVNVGADNFSGPLAPLVWTFDPKLGSAVRSMAIWGPGSAGGLALPPLSHMAPLATMNAAPAGGGSDFD